MTVASGIACGRGAGGAGCGTAAATVHCGHGPEVTAPRRAVLAAAYAAHPERFVRKPPELPATPSTGWINGSTMM
jgi:hypothetical protein